jgi:hypothetical protein
MSYPDRSNLTVALVLASAVVACVSLSAGYFVGSLLHPGQIAFADRWPTRPIAQLDPDLTRNLAERYRG